MMHLVSADTMETAISNFLSGLWNIDLFGVGEDEVPSLFSSHLYEKFSFYMTFYHELDLLCELLFNFFHGYDLSTVIQALSSV